MGHVNVFERWGRVVHHRRRIVLAIASLAVLFAVVWGTGVFSQLQTAGGVDAPNSQSQLADSTASAAFGRNAGDVVVLYSSPTETVRSPEFSRAVTATLSALPPGAVASTTSFWSTGSSRFVSADGHETYVVLELTGGSDTARQNS